MSQQTLHCTPCSPRVKGNSFFLPRNSCHRPACPPRSQRSCRPVLTGDQARTVFYQTLTSDERQHRVPMRHTVCIFLDLHLIWLAKQDWLSDANVSHPILSWPARTSNSFTFPTIAAGLTLFASWKWMSNNRITISGVPRIPLTPHRSSGVLSLSGLWLIRVTQSGGMRGDGPEREVG